MRTDDALSASESTNNILRDELGKYFELKTNLLGRPKACLGSSSSEVFTSDTLKSCDFRLSQCTQSVVKIIEDRLSGKGWNLPKNYETLFTSS